MLPKKYFIWSTGKAGNQLDPLTVSLVVAETEKAAKTLVVAEQRKNEQFLAEMAPKKGGKKAKKAKKAVAPTLVSVASFQEAIALIAILARNDEFEEIAMVGVIGTHYGEKYMIDFMMAISDAVAAAISLAKAQAEALKLLDELYPPLS